MLVISSCFAGTTQASDFYVYPAKGQTQQQQDKDIQECQKWATGQTGFDPAAKPKSAPQTNTQATRGGVVRGAIKGAAVGEIIDDESRKGAQVGATVGVLRNVKHRRQAVAQNQASQ